MIFNKLMKTAAFVGVIALMASCSSEPVVVTPDTICNSENAGGVVIIEGTLMFPNTMDMVSSYPLVLTLDDGQEITVKTSVGSGTNEVNKVGESYGDDELMIKGSAGGSITYVDRVRVQADIDDNCKLSDPTFTLVADGGADGE